MVAELALNIEFSIPLVPIKAKSPILKAKASLDLDKTHVTRLIRP
jgi:hypothetical protein